MACACRAAAAAVLLLCAAAATVVGASASASPAAAGAAPAAAEWIEPILVEREAAPFPPQILVNGPQWADQMYYPTSAPAPPAVIAAVHGPLPLGVRGYGRVTLPSPRPRDRGVPHSGTGRWDDKLCLKYACRGKDHGSYPHQGHPYFSEGPITTVAGPKYPYRPNPPMTGTYSLENWFQPVHLAAAYRNNPWWTRLARETGAPTVAGAQNLQHLAHRGGRSHRGGAGSQGARGSGDKWGDDSGADSGSAESSATAGEGMVVPPEALAMMASSQSSSGGAPSPAGAPPGSSAGAAPPNAPPADAPPAEGAPAKVPGDPAAGGPEGAPPAK